VPTPPRRPPPVAGGAFEGVLQAAISVVIALVGGYYADRYFGTGYVLMFVGFVLGGVAAVRRLLQISVPPAPEPHRGSTDGGGPSTVRRGDSHADRGEDGSGG
jgi:hypothetical protein